MKRLYARLVLWIVWPAIVREREQDVLSENVRRQVRTIIEAEGRPGGLLCRYAEKTRAAADSSTCRTLPASRETP